MVGHEPVPYTNYMALYRVGLEKRTSFQKLHIGQAHIVDLELDFNIGSMFRVPKQRVHPLCNLE